MSAHKAVKRYTGAHWGIQPDRVYEYPDDPYLPSHLPGMGKLFQIEYIVCDVDQALQGYPPKRGAKATLDLSGPHNLLAFTMSKPEKMYLALAPKDKESLARNPDLIDPQAHWYSLYDLNAQAPGRQSRNPFKGPKGKITDVAVQVLGVPTHIWYKTIKKGDGPSTYKHALGEESGIHPILAISADGQLWIVGGNYTVPNPGITD